MGRNVLGVGVGFVGTVSGSISSSRPLDDTGTADAQGTAGVVFSGTGDKFVMVTVSALAHASLRVDGNHRAGIGGELGLMIDPIPLPLNGSLAFNQDGSRRIRAGAELPLNIAGMIFEKQKELLTLGAGYENNGGDHGVYLSLRASWL